MKTKLLNSILFALISTYTFAQSASDALRFSQSFNGGTARFVSMGGAFGALGGDFGSLSLNPAGLGVYRSSEFTITPSFKNRTISSDYNGSNGKDSRTQLNFDNLGFVLSFKPNGETQSGLINLNLAFGYNRTNDYNSYAYASGENPTNSIMNYFASIPQEQNIDGSYLTIPTDPNDKYDPYKLGPYYWPSILAWNTFLFDPLVGGGYIRALNDGDGVFQSNSTETSGSSGDYVFSLGANFSNKLFIGATFTSQNINFSYSATYLEDAYSSNDTLEHGDQFYALDYYQNFETKGTGYNLKIGGIYKPIEGFRLGLAFHTPTYYNLEDTYSYSIKSYMRSGTYKESSPNGIYDYHLETPLKTIASIAYVFKDFGLISFDYEFVNYSTMRFNSGSDGESYTDVNNSIKDTYKNVNNIKVGGEVRLKDIFIRGGYAYYPSPYKKGYLNENANRSIVSGGIGYRSGNFFVDAAYLYSIQNEKYIFYNIQNTDGSLAINPVSTKMTEGKFLVTLGFKF